MESRGGGSEWGGDGELGWREGEDQNGEVMESRGGGSEWGGDGE